MPSEWDHQLDDELCGSSEGEDAFEAWLAGESPDTEPWRGDVHYADWPWEWAPPEWHLTGHWAPTPNRYAPERYAVEKLIAHAFDSPTWSCPCT